MRRMLPFCLDLAGLLGDGWSREPPHPCVTLVQHREMSRSQFCQIPVKISAWREPLWNHQRRQSICRWRLQGHVKKMGGPAGQAAETREQEGWCEAAPTHVPPIPRAPSPGLRARRDPGGPGVFMCCITQRGKLQPCQSRNAHGALSYTGQEACPCSKGSSI